MNRKWKITFDPLRLLNESINLASLEEEARERGEDIFQASAGRLTLDLGWYRDRYRIALIEDKHWDPPLESSEFNTLPEAVRQLKVKLSKEGEPTP